MVVVEKRKRRMRREEEELSYEQYEKVKGGKREREKMKRGD